MPTALASVVTPETYRLLFRTAGPLTVRAPLIPTELAKVAAPETYRLLFKAVAPVTVKVPEIVVLPETEIPAAIRLPQTVRLL